jgi:DNA-binding FadR family transcriptional regulator
MSDAGERPAIDAVLRPVRAPTPFEETVERLGTAIRLGLLPAGTRLPPERQLAEQLQISRGTLGKVLATLTQSGHITSARGRFGGTYVSEAPPLADDQELEGQARELLRWRAAVEIASVALASEAPTAADLDVMREAVDAMDVAARGDYVEYRRLDGRFHIALAEASGSARLVAVMTEAQAALSTLLGHIAHPQEVRVHANEQHRELLGFIESRDAAAAVTAMREHVGGTELIVTGLLGSADQAVETNTDLTSE